VQIHNVQTSVQKCETCRVKHRHVNKKVYTALSPHSTTSTSQTFAAINKQSKTCRDL